MKSLFKEEAHEEIINRLEKLDENSKPLWGSMTVGQMVHHCQFPLNIILEKEDYNLKPNWLVKLFFKKAMYSDKPWRKELPTVPAFKVKNDKDFKKEKVGLKDLIMELNEKRDRNDWKAHPSFGKFTKEQGGKMQYKHLDHHFRQFGV